MVSLRPLAALPVVGVVADARTYRHLLYLLVAVPLGFLYSGIGSFALVFGVVGVPVGLNLTNLIAGGARLMAVALLGDDAGGDAGDESDADRVTVDRDDDGTRESGDDDRDGEDLNNDGNDPGADRGEQSGESLGPDTDGFEFDADPADPETEPDDRG